MRFLLIFVPWIFPLFLRSQEVPSLDTFRLNTGLKVYLLQYGEDSVLNVRLAMEGGKRNENSCQVGYSEIIQHLLEVSVNEQNKGQRKFQCSIKGEQSILQANCSVRDFDAEMGILGNAIVRLAFEKDKIQAVVSKMVEHYKQENLSVWDLSELYAEQILYGLNNPPGRKYCQYQIEKVLPVELREFYVSHYTPETSSLIICGNFNAAKVKKIIKKHFVKWRPLRKLENAEEKEVLMFQKFRGKEISLVNSFATDKYMLKWIFPAVPARSEDLPAFTVLCALFDRYLSKIMEEHGSSGLNFRPVNFNSGVMTIHCFSEKAVVKTAVALLEQTLETFRLEKIDESEYKIVVKKLFNDFDKQKEPKRILELYNPLLYDFEIRKNYLRNLTSLSPQSLQNVLQKYFNSDVYKLIVIGKSHLVAQDLQAFGKLRAYQTSDFETCDESCKEVVIIKYHCESCRRRGLGYVWRFNPADKEAIERARARKE